MNTKPDTLNILALEECQSKHSLWVSNGRKYLGRSRERKEVKAITVYRPLLVSKFKMMMMVTKNNS
jgi:hypothetical protein